MSKLLPRARKNGLAMEQIEDELLVYDLDRNKAYCLNRTAALVWQHCNGRTSPAEMAKLLRKKLGVKVEGKADGKVDERAVWYALDQLSCDRLLDEKIALPDDVAGMTR